VYAITIDRNTGLLTKKGCKDIMTEYFLEGTIPTAYSTECGEVRTSDSFNIDIFNREEEPANLFGDVPEPGSSEYRREPGVWYDSGIEDQGYDLEGEQYEGEEHGAEPSTDGDFGEEGMPSSSETDKSEADVKPLSVEEAPSLSEEDMSEEDVSEPDTTPLSVEEAPSLSEEDMRDSEAPQPTATDLDSSADENDPEQSTLPPEEYREPLTSEL
jgi:hypothetical protein